GLLRAPALGLDVAAGALCAGGRARRTAAANAAAARAGLRPSTHAVATGPGLAARRAAGAGPVRAAGIRLERLFEHLLDPVDEDELDVLAQMLGDVLDVLLIEL